jgi:hypothetical protein
MKRPEFLMVLPADVGEHGYDGAILLALMRYVTALDGESNGRVRIDGDIWWRASQAEIGEAMGGVGHDKVRGIVRRLLAAGALEVRPASDGQSVRMMAYRLSEQPKRDTAFTSTASEEVNAKTHEVNAKTHRSKRRSASEVNADPRFPLLTRELNKEPEEEREGGERAREARPPAAPIFDPWHPDDEPLLGCDKHPDGTEEPCGACKHRRLTNERWWREKDDYAAAYWAEHGEQVIDAEVVDDKTIAVFRATEAWTGEPSEPTTVGDVFDRMFGTGKP